MGSLASADACQVCPLTTVRLGQRLGPGSYAVCDCSPQMRALVPSKRTSPTEGTKRLGADHGWSTGSDPCCRSRVEGYEGPQPSPEDRPRSHVDLDRPHPHRCHRRHRCVDGAPPKSASKLAPSRWWSTGHDGGRGAVTTAASGSPRVHSFQSSTTRTRPAG